MKADTFEIARGLRATIQKLEQLKRHQPHRFDELTRRQNLMRSKLRRLKRGERVT